MVVHFDSFQLDFRRFLLRRGAERIRLRPKVFDLLAHLVRHRDRVVTRGELFEVLWGGTRVAPGSLSGLVNELRRALGESGRGRSSIRTVHARGYQFVARVEDDGWSGPDPSSPPVPGGDRAGTSAVGPSPRSAGGGSRASEAGGLSGVVGVVGVDEALDRVRFALGRCLRDGARLLVVEPGVGGSEQELLERTTSLARTLGFEIVRQPAGRTTEAADPGGEQAHAVAEAGALWPDPIRLRRSTRERALVVIVEAGPDALLGLEPLLRAMGDGSLRDTPVLLLWLVDARASLLVSPSEAAPVVPASRDLDGPVEGTRSVMRTVRASERSPVGSPSRMRRGGRRDAPLGPERVRSCAGPRGRAESVGGGTRGGGGSELASATRCRTGLCSPWRARGAGRLVGRARFQGCAVEILEARGCDELMTR